MLPHLWESDLREPLFTWKEYGFYWLSLTYWLEILSVLCFQTALGYLVGLLLYNFIIKPQKYESSFSYLLVYGIILPFWIVWPVCFIQLFGIRHFIFKFFVGVIATVYFFRSTEAVHGFAPSFTTSSSRDFCIYYASVLNFSHDKDGKFIKVSRRKALGYAFNFLLYLLFTGTLKSMMVPHKNFSMFGSPIDSLDEWVSIKRFFTWELYANSALHARKF